jgi:galactitol-specific phosphotransferase system IIB component
MARPLKILAVCGNGMGSSLLVKMALESILADLGVYGIIESTSVSQAAGLIPWAELVITSTSFYKGIESVIPEGKPVITLKNIFDKVEMGERVKDYIKTRQES